MKLFVALCLLAASSHSLAQGRVYAIDTLGAPEFFSFPVTDPFDQSHHGEVTSIKPLAMDFDPTGTFLYVSDFTVGQSWDHVYTLNPDTGELAFLFRIQTDEVAGLSVDPTTGILYIANNEFNSLHAYDPSNQHEYFIGSLRDIDGNLISDIIDLAADNHGDLYALDRSERLWQVHKPSAICTLRGTVDHQVEGSAQGMDFDPETNVLYACLSRYSPGVYATIDPTDASITTIANLEDLPDPGGEGRRLVMSIRPDLSCPGDCDGDYNFTVLDFICFQSLFIAGDVDADCNGDGQLNALDFVCFQLAFQQGCR